MNHHAEIKAISLWWNLWPGKILLAWHVWLIVTSTNGVTTSTDSGFTAMIGYSQYLIMPKHLSKELAEPMNINWKTSSQVSTGLRMDKCQSSTIVINKLKTS